MTSIGAVRALEGENSYLHLGVKWLPLLAVHHHGQVLHGRRKTQGATESISFVMDAVE